jgi:hypothetical protein
MNGPQHLFCGPERPFIASGWPFGCRAWLKQKQRSAKQ